ncbi:glycosyltransferase family 2 protein [Cellulomonas cellasea]|uniref:glycosyltransferase family 2 protein n=1 Tax=Cellulomonas cellasea TaxID=43670 RepID=UPI0025A32353|nr:glycosyltransferase family 2 protein [Cellulomonas cellasea]MDM8084671.1 glycosyltransferase family 2 protein [Cellulomonas cellasea]
MSGRTAGADVTVVTVTYNGVELVDRCLEALARQDLGGLTMDVVVVDNASTDGTPELVAARHPAARLVASPANLGFAGGNNLVLDTAASPYVILLNNDAVPEPDFVATLVRGMDEAPDDVACLTATVLLAQRFRPASAGEAGAVLGPDGAYAPDAAGPVTLVNSTGNVVRTDGFGMDRGWLADAASHHPPAEVFGFCGAAAILRTSALRDVGTFDEDFFLYYEDTDLSWRLRLAGYQIRHCPAAVVHHEHAASTGEGSELFRFHDGRNRLLMLAKNASAPMATRAVLRYLVTTASIGLRRRQPWPMVRTRLRVIASFTRLLPRMLRKRRRLSRESRTARAQVERLLTAPPTMATGGYRG